MAGETFDQPAGFETVETFLVERGGKRTQAGFGVAHRHRADRGTENQPVRGLILVGPARPREAAAADQTAIDPDGVRPFERDRLLRRRMHRERISQRGQAGIERAPCRAQGLVGLQHHGEFGQIEAADKDQRAGALVAGDDLPHA